MSMHQNCMISYYATDTFLEMHVIDMIHSCIFQFYFLIKMSFSSEASLW